MLEDSEHPPIGGERLGRENQKNLQNKAKEAIIFRIKCTEGDICHKMFLEEMKY